MLLFFDMEFTGLHKNTTPISLGIVAEDGSKFYAEFTDYDKSQVDCWIKENVIDNTIIGENNNFYELHKNDKSLTASIGIKKQIQNDLLKWLKGFNSIQFISDVCHYDFVLLIDIFGTAFDLPENICATCHDINQDIACYYGISEQEAFDKNREKIVMELCGHEIEGRKHNALYDAEVIKMIYEMVNKQL